MARVAPFLSFLLVLTLVSGCAVQTSKTPSWRSETVDFAWPEPPDQPRVRYLRSLSGSKDFDNKSRTSDLLNWMLGEREQGPPLLSPFAVAASRSGLVWVADNGSRMLYRIDMLRSKVDYFQDFAGTSLLSPSGIVVDEERQRVFLADAGLRRIFVLDTEGNFLDSWGLKDKLERPAGLAMDSSGRLLVADAVAGFVYVLNPDGAMVSKIGSKVNADGRFKRPLSVAVGPNGEMLILDAFAFHVEVLDAQGELLGVIGQLGDAAGYLARPKGLAVDLEGHVFISDSAFDNIQAFDMAGNLLMFWGRAGKGAGQFNLPAGLFVDHEGRLFVADSYNRRVQVFQLLH